MFITSHLQNFEGILSKLILYLFSSFLNLFLKFTKPYIKRMRSINKNTLSAAGRPSEADVCLSYVEGRRRNAFPRL